jgi:hypothetical protein
MAKVEIKKKENILNSYLYNLLLVLKVYLNSLLNSEI